MWKLICMASLLAHHVTADCQDSGCPDGQSCCMCSCNPGDYTVGSFSCNCDATKKHKPLPNADQPTCCGGQFGFDAWCLRANSTAVNDPKCSSQETSGIPLPNADFYEFGTTHRCVAGQCKSGFCDNPAIPNWDDLRCHKP